MFNNFCCIAKSSSDISVKVKHLLQIFTEVDFIQNLCNNLNKLLSTIKVLASIILHIMCNRQN